MSINTDIPGRRSVEEAFEVVGTPEEVWQAIATGPGLSAWFVPAKFEERDGRPVTMALEFPGITISAAITEWDPPRRYAGQNEGWGGSPAIATEWNVEAGAGGTCVVRVVHSLFASTEAWDDQLEGAKSGWSGFLAILRVYLAHFRGQPWAMTQLRNPAAGTDAEVWDAMLAPLGLTGLTAGQRFSAPAGAPPFSGVVEYANADPYDALLRVDEPAPGIIALGIAGMPGGPSTVGVNLYLYGDEAVAALARETKAWETWLQKHFPSPAEAGGSD